MLVSSPVKTFLALESDLLSSFLKEARNHYNGDDLYLKHMAGRSQGSEQSFSSVNRKNRGGGEGQRAGETERDKERGRER